MTNERDDLPVQQPKRELTAGKLAAAIAMLPMALAGSALLLVPVIGIIWGADYLRWRAWALWLVPITCLLSMVGFLNAESASDAALLAWTGGVWLYGGTVLWMLPAEEGSADKRVRAAILLWVASLAVLGSAILFAVAPALAAPR